MLDDFVFVKGLKTAFADDDLSVDDGRVNIPAVRRVDKVAHGIVDGGQIQSVRIYEN
jgi:hypothetical protein